MNPTFYLLTLFILYLLPFSLLQPFTLKLSQIKSLYFLIYNSGKHKPKVVFYMSIRCSCVPNDTGTRDSFWTASFNSETLYLSWPLQNQVTAAWLPNLVWYTVNSQGHKSLSYSYVSTGTIPKQKSVRVHLWF